MGQLIKPLIIGMIVTKIAYLIPGLNVIAGIFGGFVAAYVYNGGPLGGVKVGLLKGLLFFIPAVVLAFLFADILSGIPVIGDILGASVIVFAAGMTAYTTVKAVIGGFIGGLLARMLRSQQGRGVENTTTQASPATTRADPVTAGTETAHNEHWESPSEQDRGHHRETEQAPGPNQVEQQETTPTAASNRGHSRETKHTSEPDRRNESGITHCPECGCRVEQRIYCPECGYEVR